MVNYTDIRNYYGTSASTNANIWPAWNAQYTGTCALYTQTTNGIGYGWPFYTTNGTSATTTANTITEYVWTHWNETHQVINGARDRAKQIRQYSRRQMTDEEVRAALEQEKIAREAAEARALRAQQAQARAEALLQTFLSPQQKEDLETKRCFYIEVPNKDGKTERYRIDRGSHGNVKQLDDRGSVIRSFCVQPEGVPQGDSMLAQKLFLESSDETRDEFWKTANITTLVKEKEVPFNIPREHRRKYAAEHGLLH